MNELHEAVVAAFRNFVAADEYVYIGQPYGADGPWRLTLDGSIDLPEALALKLVAYVTEVAG